MEPEDKLRSIEKNLRELKADGVEFFGEDPEGRYFEDLLDEAESRTAQARNILETRGS